MLNGSNQEKATPIITLIGKEQAKVGHRFIYLGPIAECKECPLKNICFNLEKGRRYRITKLRDREHKCRIFSEGVRVVEVERMPFHSSIPKNLAIEGSVVTASLPDCRKRGCEYWGLCHPVSVENGAKIRILKLGEPVRCPAGFNPVEGTVDFAD